MNQEKNKKLQLLKSQQDSAFNALSGILGGMAAPVRIKLIHFLSQSPLSVDVLAEKIDQSVANTSMHLRKMYHEKLVTVSAIGQRRLYSLHPATQHFWEACQEFLLKLDPSLKLDVAAVYEEMNWTDDLKTTSKLLRQKELLLLDVRPEDERGEELNHIDVLQISANEISKNISKLPKRKPVLVICRGRFCALSAYVVSELRKAGINAFRFDQSWFALKLILNEKGGAA